MCRCIVFLCWKSKSKSKAFSPPKDCDFLVMALTRVSYRRFIFYVLHEIVINYKFYLEKFLAVISAGKQTNTRKCKYICRCKYAHMRTYIYIYIHTYIHSFIFIHAYSMYLHVFVYVGMHFCVLLLLQLLYIVWLNSYYSREINDC